MAAVLALLSLLTAISLPLVTCELYTDPALLPKTQYDFVIVGAGTAGNVLASRLTENPGFSVLVIEAGPSNTAVEAVEVPFLDWTLIPNTSITWNYTTTPQAGLHDRLVPFPRGRVLGGSSTINWLFWTRGSVDDFDRYANITGDGGWSWDEMLPYMKKSESLVPPGNHMDPTGKIVPDHHGVDGPIHISLTGHPAPIGNMVLGMTTENAPRWPYNEDMNSGYPMGLGWAQHSITTSGRRSSSATGYLHPALSRPNLDVLIVTTVTRLIASNTSATHDGMLSFTQVEMAQTASSPRFTVSATKEVILCAGAVGTPQILQLSGIGDAEFLESVGVIPLVNNSEVGKNLMDHPLIANHWLVNSTDTWDDVFHNATLKAELLAQWNTTGTGLFVNDGADYVAWSRVTPDSGILANSTDPSAGPTSPHIEFVPVNGYVPPTLAPTTGRHLAIATIIVSPASSGSIMLASNDPFENPPIDPGYMTAQFDLDAMVDAVKTCKSVLEGPSWDGYILGPAPELAIAQTDEELAEYVRNYTSTTWHPVGTARMMSASSEEGVLTPDLLVKGVSGLRVVDASVFPSLPAAHTQAPVYAVAERAADLVKAAWANSSILPTELRDASQYPLAVP